MLADITIGMIILYIFSFLLTIYLAITKGKSLSLWLLLFLFTGPVAAIILITLLSDL